MNITKLRYVDETFKNWHVGMLSFLGQRITGLALVAYLLMHLLSLSSVLAGSDKFVAMMEAYNKPLYHIVEWLLLVAVVFHLLNGLRIIVADWFGITRLQRAMFWVVAVATAALCLGSIPYFFVWR